VDTSLIKPQREKTRKWFPVLLGTGHETTTYVRTHSDSPTISLRGDVMHQVDALQSWTLEPINGQCG